MKADNKNQEAAALGVNYWPAARGLFMWRDFDPDKVAADLATMASLEIKHCRIYLTWEDFQPAPQRVATVMLDRLLKVLDAAADNRIVARLCLFCGLVGGTLWLPPWMVQAGSAETTPLIYTSARLVHNRPRDLFTDLEALAAQLFFLRELTVAVAGHPALEAWDLGNNPWGWAPPADEQALTFWLQAMVETLRERAEEVAVGLTAGGSLLGGHLVATLVVAARFLDFIGLEADAEQLPADFTVEPGLAPGFLAALASWLTQRPVVVHSFGQLSAPRAGGQPLAGGPSLAAPEEVARATAKTLRLVGAAGGSRAYWHCFQDLAPGIRERPPLDRWPAALWGGLLDYRGSSKKIVEMLRHAGADDTPAAADADWLDVDREDFLAGAPTLFSRLWRRYRDRHRG